MSDLQLALIVLGALIILGVIFFNWWQERRISRETVRRFEGPVDDALLEDFRFDPNAVPDIGQADSITIEDNPDDLGEAPAQMTESEPEPSPAFQAESAVAESSMAEETIPIAHSDAPVLSDSPKEEAGLPGSGAPEVNQAEAQAGIGKLPVNVDEKIDLVAMIHFASPLEGAALLKMLQPLPELDKPAQWIALDEGATWHALSKDQADNRFTDLACSLQLADRSGPVSAETLRNFQDKVDKLATDLEIEPEWCGAKDSPLKYAAELDQFGIEVDVVVGFHIVHGSNGPFAGTKLRGLAEAGGMKLHEDGSFHYENDAGDTIFSMLSQDQRPFRPETLRTVFYRGISFQLDVPKVVNCTEAFNQMVILAHQLEKGLDGKLVDDNQRPLGDSGIEKIRQQLKMLHAKMLERGIVPASHTAQRLFS